MFLQGGTECRAAQRPAVAVVPQLAVVEAVHARQAAAQHRAAGGRNETGAGTHRTSLIRMCFHESVQTAVPRFFPPVNDR